MKHFRRLFSILLFLIFSSLSNAGVIINEMMINPAGVSDARGEWFELYNSGPDAVNLDGWVIRDHGSNNHTISGPLWIDSLGYAVLGRNHNLDENGGVDLDYRYGSSIALSNGEDELELLNDLGAVMDLVAYSASLGFTIASGQSTALQDIALDNNVGGSWQLTEASAANGYGLGSLNFGTPGAANFPLISTGVPEPGVLTLFGAGLFAMWAHITIRRRSNHRNRYLNAY